MPVSANTPVFPSTEPYPIAHNTSICLLLSRAQVASDVGAGTARDVSEALFWSILHAQAQMHGFI